MIALMCDCCGEEVAVMKDYRESGGILYEFLVCVKCSQRTHTSFWTKHHHTQKKIKRLISDREAKYADVDGEPQMDV